jgi:hypothetical protein
MCLIVGLGAQRRELGARNRRRMHESGQQERAECPADMPAHAAEAAQAMRPVVGELGAPA